MEIEASSINRYVPRPIEHERLVAFLLDQRFFLPVAISTSLPGARGFGKTSLARAICQDPRVMQAFSEGIYWVTLGQGLSPLELISRVEQLIYDLTGERSVLEDVAAAEAQLHEMLHPRRTLLVIDEADNEEALRPFLHSGPGGACLLITHDDMRLPLGARRVSVDIMMPQESVALLSQGLSVMEPQAENQVFFELPGDEPLVETPADLPEGVADFPEIHPEIGEEDQEEAPEATFQDAAAAADAEGVEPAAAPAGEMLEEPSGASQEETFQETPPEEKTESGDLADQAIPADTALGTEPGGVLDAVFPQEDVKPVEPLSYGGTFLIDSSTLAGTEKETRIASTPSPEALRLFETLADRLNEWPLLLTLINGLLRGYFDPENPVCQSTIEALRMIHTALDRQGLVTGWRIDDPVLRQQALANVLAACLEPLDPSTRDHYLDLAVFPMGEDIPFTAASVLWSRDVDETRADCERLARRALVDIDLENDTFRLQVALRNCLLDQLRAGQLTALHNRLLDGYRRRMTGGWASGPDDGYYFQHLASHLIAAGRRSELTELLFDYNWLSGFLNCANCIGGRRADIYSLLGDYERALSSALDSQSAQLRLVQDALRLSAPALARDLKQLAPQLMGRLLLFKEPEIQGLIKKAAAWHTDPWLRPLAACFDPPGGDEVRVLNGHTDWVTGVAILPDGQHAVSSSLDGTLRLWDLANGQTDRVIAVAQIEEEESEIVSAVSVAARSGGALVSTGQMGMPPRHEPPGGVSAVVITPDGHKAITSGWDGMVRVWNLVTGHEERAISAHIEAVGALAITPDGKRIISAADDRLIRVWDLVSGEQLLELAGHGDLVRALAVTPDGRTLVSGSWDYTLRLWDLDNGAPMQIMTGHEGWVQAIAISPDGSQVLSSSWDQTVRIWDLWTGETVRVLSEFRAPIFAMIVAPGNQLMIAGGGDGSLSLWDLKSGEHLRTLPGHAGGINSLALTSSGRFAVSASDDDTLRVWDLVAVHGVALRPGHTAPVHALSALPDPARAVSASWDGTLKIWEPSTGREVQKLDSHSDGVVAMALAADGRRAISGSRDRTLKLWDLASGKEIISLEGHESAITAVAISPDATLAASGDDGGVVRAWDLSSGACLAEFHGEASIWACAITPDGKTVMASESGGKMYFLAIER
jgi:WD40 repeat protein